MKTLEERADHEVALIEQDEAMPDENGVIEHVEQPQPTAEGAEEIGVYDIANKWAVWVKGNEVAARDSMVADIYGLLNVHAQKIADKMVSERLKNAPKNCPKAAQCAHVEGGMKCPPNVICPI